MQRQVPEMGELRVDSDRIEDVASRMDLRVPNREAMESLVYELAMHVDVEERTTPFEAVIDSATGVGKTYIMAACIEYLAGARGLRNFAVIAPGSTIRDKTIGNFTAGHRKSLLPMMDCGPFLVTADNFNSPATKAILDDESRTKIFVFTVQSLIAPTTKQGRKTHDFTEGLGSGFYQHLANLKDLVVFADEHHCYSGPKFSATINELEPHVLVGLTATPLKQDQDKVIYRYPLAAAIAEQYVKTPVIVARRDDRSDSSTKLADGVTLLRYKAAKATDHCAEFGLPMLNPVMLVVAQNTEEADEYATILGSTEFDGGAWAGTILTVHSKLSGDDKERALAALEAVEDPDSPVRIIISVGMLKEGWDVKNVYVIASMRSSVSKVLTEQTLGRGLRLAFGVHTGIELLDTVEVLAHERYEALLKNAGVLNEQFIDRRTRSVLSTTPDGKTVVASEDDDVNVLVIAGHDFSSTPANTTNQTPEPAMVAATTGAAALESWEERTASLGQQVSELETLQTYMPNPDRPPILVPVLRMTKVQANFSLADIVDLDPFVKLGKQIAADPEDQLRRVKVSAKIITGPDGLRRTELVTRAASDKLEASTTLLPLETLRAELIDAVLGAPVVPQRADQARAVQPLIDAFFEGLSQDKAVHLLSAYGPRAAARLVTLVTTQQRQYQSAPSFEDVVTVTPLGRPRSSMRRQVMDPHEPFSKQAAYDSWNKSFYGFDWFDSEPERRVATIVDDSDAVDSWVRLQISEVPILWRSDGREYNADLIVVETAGKHWVVEIKADNAIPSEEVQAKRTAAKRWVQHVNAATVTGTTWGYLLVSQTDIDQCQGSWSALKSLGT